MNNSTNPKKVIEEIYDKNWRMSHPDQAMDQESMLKIISQKIYPDSHRFLMELFQNFDDSSLSNNFLDLTFTICDDFIIASHQGRPFDEHDVNSICSTGNSTKMKNHKSTGNMGIGFKSVFMHSNKVIIISNGYCFRFDKEHFDNPDHCWQEDWGRFNVNYKDLRKPWQKIPIWTEMNKLDKRITSITSNFENNFVFYFHSSKILNACKSYIYKVLDDPFYFLFLKCQNIKIEIVENEKQKNLIKSNLNGNSRITIDDKEPYYFYVKKYEIFMEVEEKMIQEETSVNQISIEDSFAPQKFKELRKIDFSFGVQLEKCKDNNFKITALPKERRLIYTLLPTSSNFNFPFLTNANFYLDAGRTQIIDDPWNLKIFSYLPQYINKFIHTDLFEKFGNSFCECLLDLKHINILNQNFLKIFNFNNEMYLNKTILLKTNNGSIKEISRCILNTFHLQVNQRTYTEFLDILKIIYEDGQAEKIMKEYFDEKILVYDASHQIVNDDVIYASKLLEYYPNNEQFYTITKEELILFLESSTYKKYFNPKTFRNLLGLIKSLRDFNDQRFSDIKFILDSKNEFKSPKEVQIIEESDINSNEENISARILLKTNSEDIDHNLYSILELEHKSMLISLGVKLIYASTFVEYILADLKNLYNKETSIQIIRILFDFVTKRANKAQEVYRKLSDLKFLSEGDQFLSMYSLHIGKFYDKQTNCKYLEYGISKKYYKDGTKLEDWVNFFKGIGIIYDEEQICRNFSENELKENPFFNEEYKHLVLKSNNPFPVKLTVYPFLENICDNTDLQKISTFFKKYWKQSGSRKKNYIPSFLEWYVIKIKKLIPNQSLNLIHEEDIYNEDIINSEIEIFSNNNNNEIIKNLLKEVLNFPCEKLKSPLVDEMKFNNQLRLKDRVSLLQKIISNFSTRSNDKILKEYFLKLFSELVIREPKYNYTFNILNEDFEFKPPQDLYYIDINETDFLFKALLSKKYSKIFIPDFSKIFGSKVNDPTFQFCRGNFKYQDIQQKYLNFCIKCGVKVFRKNDLHKVITDQTQEHIISNYFKQNNFYENLKSTINVLFKTNKDTNLLKNVEFYSCSNILIKSNYGENFDLVAYMEIMDKTKKSKIYYLKDDTYVSWTHPTILYFLAKFIGIVIDCKEAEMEILTLLRQNSTKDVEAWISKGYIEDD
jgi:hypothetical protein